MDAEPPPAKPPRPFQYSLATLILLSFFAPSAFLVYDRWPAWVEIAALDGYLWNPDGAISKDDRLLAYMTRDNCTHVYSLRHRAEVCVLRGHTALVETASLSPDGKLVVTAGRDGTVRIWDVGSGAQLHACPEHSESALCATFSPDGERIVAGYADGAVNIWNVRTREFEKSLQHAGCVRHATFSTDGKLILTDSGGTGAMSKARPGETLWGDGTTRLWEVNGSGSWKRLWNRKNEEAPDVSILRDFGRLSGCSPDGSRYLSRMSYYEARTVHDAKTNEVLSELPHTASSDTTMFFSPRGDRIITSASTGLS